MTVTCQYDCNLVPGGAITAFFILLMKMAHWAFHASQMPMQSSEKKRPLPHNNQLINLPAEMTRCFLMLHTYEILLARSAW